MSVCGGTWSHSTGVQLAAAVYVPSKHVTVVTEGGNTLTPMKIVRFLRVESNAAVYAVGSGTYRFQSRLSKLKEAQQ